MFMRIMTSYKVLLLGMLLDVIFTATSYFIVGDWRFEGNPLLPSMWYYVVAINVMALLCSCYSKWVIYVFNLMRALALVSHIILWVQLARGVHMFPGQQFSVCIPLALAFPAILICIERIGVYITKFIIDRIYA